jgi:hypothetical protein
MPTASAQISMNVLLLCFPAQLRSANLVKRAPTCLATTRAMRVLALQPMKRAIQPRTFAFAKLSIISMPLVTVWKSAAHLSAFSSRVPLLVVAHVE